MQELADAYNQTRIDYIVPMPMTVARLQEYIDVYDVDLSASCAAVHEEEDLILGIGMLGIRPGRAWITRLGVLPYARRLGTGGHLMKYLIAQARRRELPEIWLEVIKGNAPAHAMFRKFGFRQTRELIACRRPPTPPERSDPPSCVTKITMLKRESALELLEERRRFPNWLNQTETFCNITNLMGLLVDIEGGRRGWVIYESSLLQLKRILVEVVAGDETEVTEIVLRTLHTLAPRQDAVCENISVDDPRWTGYQAAGYFESFHRLEMVKAMGAS